MWNIKQNIYSYGKQGEQLFKWGGHSASLDKIKYNAEGNADSRKSGHKVMQQANIINVITNKYEPQKSTALERSVKLLGGLNRFYGIPTSPSASIMAQNIQLFGPREGFLTHQWIITGNK